MQEKVPNIDGIRLAEERTMNHTNLRACARDAYRLTHPLDELEAGPTARYNAHLESRPHRVESIFVAQLLILQLGLGRRTHLSTVEPLLR